MRKICLIVLSATLIFGLSGCSSQKYKDGTYKAEYNKVDKYNWKGYVELDVKNDEIVNIVFNYKNDSTGLKKTEDTEYNKKMKSQKEVNPIEYTLKLQNSLLQKQEIEQIDAITGATMSSNDIKILAKAALEKAKNGDTSTSEVDIPQSNITK